uniref:XrtA-associated tyrosine autokinase n=1 Tax=Ningiella ruwaisensis TaxID=2364274 RepID=UPI00109EE701|nr:XrtA-associated tyrosine autokinase [Ningiella ruwaisensis]
MKSTIEKALQRQREAEAAKQAAQEANENTSIEKAIDSTQLEGSTSSSNTEAALSETQVNDAVVEQSVIKEKHKPQTGGKKSTNRIDIDLDRLERLGFVTLTNARRQINEEYREIKRKLIQNAFGPLSKTLPNSNIIMVSSARPSEGKTFTAINLAMSIAAEQDKTVLLVDADVLKPNVLRTLGVPEQKGLMDYLLSETDDISDVMYRTNIPKLRIIPAGSSHHLSTELLASGIMNDTVNEFSTRYSDRIVIIDTPPIIGINESAVLASFAGQAVIVVEEGRSKLHDIQQSVERLNPDMAIGFVVNKTIGSSEAGGYYGYNYYGADRESE